MQIRPYTETDESSVIDLWRRAGLLRAWNDPHEDIARKLRVQRDLFLVAIDDGDTVGAVMAGYDGHRGWMNYLAVSPDKRRAGIGRALCAEVERRLAPMGCPKINVQVRRDNLEAGAFYTALGYKQDDVVSFGKRLDLDAHARVAPTDRNAGVRTVEGGSLERYKAEFIEFMITAGVLRFGDFVTKSGRKTPFFIDTGRYRTGAQLARLGRYYAAALQARLGKNFDVLFGPAYKGIPLVVTTAMALADLHGHDVGFCFNRKEAKDHGERGILIGHSLTQGDRVVIVEDVTTAGTSIRETVPILRAAAEVHLAGLVVSVDRMERGSGELNALAEVAQTHRMPAFAIVTIEEIMTFAHGRPIGGQVVLDDGIYERMLRYRAEYGGHAPTELDRPTA